MSEETQNLGVVLERIANLSEKMDINQAAIDKHFKLLNGQTAKNSKFRIQGRIYFGILFFLLTAMVIPVLLMLFETKIL